MDKESKVAYFSAPTDLEGETCTPPAEKQTENWKASGEYHEENKGEKLW
jgi:hypothetical protein